MALPDFPYIRWRPQPDGALRPRFHPPGRIIALGFKGCDLRHPGRGPWFTFEEVRSWFYGSDGKGGVHADITAARAAGRRPAGAITAMRGRLVDDLLQDWLRAIAHDKGDDRLSDNTLDSYRKDVAALTWRPESRADAKARRTRARAGDASETRLKEPFVLTPVDAIGPPELKAHFDYVKRVRGHHMALHVIAAFSAAWAWGQTSTRWRLGLNPRHQLKLKRPAGRLVLIEAAEIAALVGVADAIDRPSIGDAILLGLFTGQRQNDRLAIGDDGLIDGRRRFRQNKTGMVVEIKEAPRLRQRLAEARLRVTRLMLAHGVRERPATVVVDESTCRPYEVGAYRHRFTDVRTIAIHGWIVGESVGEAIARGERSRKAAAIDGTVWKIPPCPQLGRNTRGEWDPKRDQDLRDTCVTLLYRAGCNLQQIADITGHTYASVKTIVDHYLARDRASADAAIDKLVSFMEQTGMAV